MCSRNRRCPRGGVQRPVALRFLKPSSSSFCRNEQNTQSSITHEPLSESCYTTVVVVNTFPFNVFMQFMIYEWIRNPSYWTFNQFVFFTLHKKCPGCNVLTRHLFRIKALHTSWSPLSSEYYSEICSGETDVNNYEESCHTFYPSLLVHLFLSSPRLPSLYHSSFPSL